MSLFDILSTCPRYFCRKWIGATNESSNFDLRPGLIEAPYNLKSAVSRTIFLTLVLAGYTWKRTSTPRNLAIAHRFCQPHGSSVISRFHFIGRIIPDDRGFHVSRQARISQTIENEELWASPIVKPKSRSSTSLVIIVIIHHHPRRRLLRGQVSIIPYIWIFTVVVHSLSTLAP